MAFEDLFEEERPGVGEVLTEAAYALPRRIAAGWEELTAPKAPTLLGRLAERVGGAAQVVFPFTAPAEHIAGEAAVRGSDLSDEALQRRLEYARQFAPGEAPIYESLLSVPIEEREARTRQGAASGVGFLGSMIPGYTGLARLLRTARPAVRELRQAQAVAEVPKPATQTLRPRFEPASIQEIQGPVDVIAGEEIRKVSPVRSVERAPLVGPEGRAIPREDLPIPTAAEVAATRVPVLPRREPGLVDQFGRPAQKPLVNETPAISAPEITAAESPLKTAAEVAAEKTGGPFPSLDVVKADAKQSIEEYTRAVAVEAEGLINEAMRVGLEPGQIKPVMPGMREGKIDPRLAASLGRATLGAVLASSTQEEAEDKLVAAVGGAGLGWLASPGRIKRLIGAVRGVTNQKQRVNTLEQVSEQVDKIAAKPLPVTREDRLAKIAAGEPSPNIITEPVLKGSVEQQLLDIAEDVYTRSGITVRADRLHDDIVDLMHTNQITDADAIRILTDYNISKAEVADLFDMASAKAGRFLQRLSTLSKTLDAAALANVPPDRKRAVLQFLKEMEVADEALRGTGVIGRLDKIRRGLLVVQMATAMRNLETQIGRVAVDGFVDLLDLGLRKAAGAVGRPIRTDITPLDTFLVATRLLDSPGVNKAMVEKLLLEAPGGVRQYHKLFATYSSDILRADKQLARELLGDQADEILAKIAGDKTAAQHVMDKMEDFTSFLNTFNRFQEWSTRRAVFLGNLDARLRTRGLSLDEIVQANRLGVITEDDLKTAVTRALEITFAEQPAFGSVGAHLVSFINRFPLATTILPFPRFMWNSAKFVFEYNPTGFFKLLSEAERAKVAAGDFRTIARATTGSIMLVTAWQLENSDYSSDVWYLKYPSGDKTGRRVDIRSYNPFAAYAFIAHVLRRMGDGTLTEMSASDVAQGLLSTNLRAGAGLVVIDSIINNAIIPDIWQGIAEAVSGQPITATPGVQTVKRIGGELVAGGALWLSQIKDFVDQIDESGFHVPGESIVGLGPGAQPLVPERRKEPFLGPLRAKIPFIEQPPAYVPTQREPLRRPEPALRQLTGIALQPEPNAVQREMEHLGLKRSDIIRPSGDPELDETLARVMGTLNEAMSPIMAAPGWQNLSREWRLYFFRELQNELRKPAMREGFLRHPEATMKLWATQQPPPVKKMFEDYFKQRAAEPTTEGGFLGLFE